MIVSWTGEDSSATSVFNGDFGGMLPRIGVAPRALSKAASIAATGLGGRDGCKGVFFCSEGEGVEPRTTESFAARLFPLGSAMSPGWGVITLAIGSGRVLSPSTISGDIIVSFVPVLVLVVTPQSSRSGKLSSSSPAQSI